MKKTLIALALFAAMATTATTANAWCNKCNSCEARPAVIEYERVCTTCNPCGGSSFNILNPFTYFG